MVPLENAINRATGRASTAKKRALTTIEAISDHIDEYNAELDKAVEAARQMRQDAEAEDQRIQDRARTLWNKLREDYGLPPLP